MRVRADILLRALGSTAWVHVLALPSQGSQQGLLTPPRFSFLICEMGIIIARAFVGLGVDEQR